MNHDTLRLSGMSDERMGISIPLVAREDLEAVTAIAGHKLQAGALDAMPPPRLIPSQPP